MNYVGPIIIAAGVLIMMLNKELGVKETKPPLLNVIDTVNSQQKVIQDISKSIDGFQSKIDSQQTSIANLINENNEIREDQAAIHEHMARVQKSHMKIKNTFYPRHLNPRLAAPGAFPIEIMKPSPLAPTPDWDKLKKQIKKVSK